MTKTKELFFKAGLHKGRAEHWLKMRKYYIHRSTKWLECTKRMNAEEAKSERYLKRAENEAKKEKNND